MFDELTDIVKDLGGDLATGSLRVETVESLTAAEIAGRIRAFEPEDGWLCFTDKVMLLEELQSNDLDSKRLLSAELVRGEKSLHLRFQTDGWGAWVYHHAETGNDLILEQRFLGTSRTRGKCLAYQTLYAEDSQGVLQPSLSRFAGFVEGGV